jgi:DNA-binding NarL/FixJ family response regulator
MIGQMLAGMLRTIRGIGSVSLTGTVVEGIEASVRQDVDLLVLDLLLPDGEGLTVLRAAIEYHPRLTCIILSSVADDCVCPKELLPHVAAIVDKAAAIDRLRLLVEKVVQKKLGLHSGVRRPDPSRILSPRELEVFERIGEGMTTREIAESLSITVHTVNSHRKAIVAKLGAVGAELVRLAALYNSNPSTASRSAKRIP